MKMGVYLSQMTRPELEELESVLDLTDSETEVFRHLSKGRSKEYIAYSLSVSIGTISNRIEAIRKKVERIEQRGNDRSI